MTIREIKDKNIWEDFLSRCREKTFLQSWGWGDFQVRQGNKIWRWGIYENDELVGTVLISKIEARRGTYFLIQHGPNVKNYDLRFKIMEVLLAELKKLGAEEKADFSRIAPLFERNDENKRTFGELGLKESPMHANAYEASWKLDITLGEEDLLKKMRKTTRYLIRQAAKNPDIAVERSESGDDLTAYQELNRKVAQRQKFVAFSSEYIKNEFEIFSADGQAVWLLGRYKGDLAAAALVILWSGIAFYHQAASDARYSRYSVPYLIQWEAIREAKKRGCVLYDFWGYVDPEKQPKHPWAGPTLFKMGYGGQAHEYVKTQDLPLTKKYRLIRFFEQLRRMRRGL